MRIIARILTPQNLHCQKFSLPRAPASRLACPQSISPYHRSTLGPPSESYNGWYRWVWAWLNRATRSTMWSMIWAVQMCTMWPRSIGILWSKGMFDRWLALTWTLICNVAVLWNERWYENLISIVLYSYLHCGIYPIIDIPITNISTNMNGFFPLVPILKLCLGIY